jgi:peptidoglycan-associated lipoprotein
MTRNFNPLSKELVMRISLRRSAIVALSVVAAAILASCSTPKPMGPVATQSRPPPPPPLESSPYRAPGSGSVSEGSGAPIPGSTQDFVINVGDRVYFDFDKYTVRDDGRPILDAQAAWLRRYPMVRVRIEGNTDELGTREYNFALGARRANSVMQYLAGRGVEPSRIDTVSYGKEHPVDTSGGDAAQAHNRNAHTTITSGAR